MTLLNIDYFGGPIKMKFSREKIEKLVRESLYKKLQEQENEA